LLFLKNMYVKSKKSLGQNFLIDNNILKKIVDVGKISKIDSVIEIGPGTGNLTNYIIDSQPKDITVVEKDSNLVKILKNKFNNKINIINDDVLELDENFYKKKFTVFGNLPYNISTQILANWCLNNNLRFKRLILMFQKEVADRIIAKVNTKEYSRITILANWKFDIKKIFDVSPNCFFPRPKIESTLLEFLPKTDYIKIRNPKYLEKITKIFFSQRRKMIKKNFMKLFKDSNYMSKKLKIQLSDRPQNLSTDKFLMIIKEYENSLR
tara:strand:+ start:6467 stop:7267 length:801 start_codon:yes stop_codon:yes gene_type:complete